MYQYIFDHLPYKSSFRFVDGISFLDQDKVIGHYTPKEDAFFYKDHFPGNPVTPGAILTEIMAQIGLVVLGIYLIVPSPGEAAQTPGEAAPAGQVPTAAADTAIFPLLTSTEVSFLKMALPGQKITVISHKEYFRFDKLKCRVEAQDAAGERLAKGVFSGIIKKISK
jgi:3-hydroxyacyl-[acyl-carrier-protein] dehydratase